LDTVKIIHCADLHFDTPFADIGDVDKVEQRKEDLRETFGQIIDIAKNEGVQILLISGDLFDGKSVMRMTLEYILKKISEIPDIKVFIAPGNHDPYTEKSYYKIMNWPSNVHIFDNTFSCIKLPELNTKIHGIGFSQAYEKECLIKGFTHDDDNVINIMVIHGEIVEGKRECNYNPLTYQDIERTNVDYIALGHKHSYSGINRVGKTYWAYCGAPEGRGFDELGDKGIIIGDIGKGYVDLEFRKICKRKYIQKEIDITGASTYEDIEELIMSKIEYKESKNDLYKIILTGEVPEGHIFNTSVIKQKLEDKFYYLKVVDDTKLKIDYDTLKNEFSLKGLFVKKILDKIENTNDEKLIEQYSLAMKIGLKSLENESGDLY
jgi:exonuclease SbcD